MHSFDVYFSHLADMVEAALDAGFGSIADIVKVQLDLREGCL